MNQHHKSSDHTQLNPQQMPLPPVSHSAEQSGQTAEGEGTLAPWHCDTYCRKVRYVSCEGRALADPSSPNCCPYLEEMLY
ncbi:MAG: hypothetical protein LUH58_10650 [Lachnospiraceae bacterium]|nr:hypothetical protein [Lachnospiraceae bacterium]